MTTEKNNLQVQAETVLAEKLSFIESAVAETVHTGEDMDEEELELRAAMAKIMTAMGLVSCPVPVLFFTKDNGWRETLRQLVSLLSAMSMETYLANAVSLATSTCVLLFPLRTVLNSRKSKS